MLESIRKLYESSHLDDYKWTLATGEVICVFGKGPDDPDAINWGEQWRKIAAEIEAEIAENFMELPKDADGVPIRYGDIVTAETCGGGEFVVFAVASDYWVDIDGFTHKPGVTHHIKHDPLRELLCQFVGDYADSSGPGYDEECVSRYADRIRELMEVGE